MTITRIIYALFALLLMAGPLHAESSRQLDITRASVFADSTAITAGEPFRLGVLLEPKPGWHSYWENPGDAGIPTTLQWSAPMDFAVSRIEWPVPERINEGPLTIYGYHNTVFLPVTVTPPTTLTEGESHTFKVKAQWLICLDICIPESAELDITLPVGPAAPSSHEPWFTEHQLQRPAVIIQPFTYIMKDQHIELVIPLSTLSVRSVQTAYFLPREKNMVRYAAEQSQHVENNTLYLNVPTTDHRAAKNLSGLLVVVDPTGIKLVFDVAFAAPEETVAPQETASPVAQPSPAPVAQASPPILFLLLGAMLGGLILNLMPCVLPVLSLKALAVIKKASGGRAQTLKHGIAYTLGILLCFALLASILIGLQQSGEAVGWGYQMQSPAFVGFLVYLLFLVGLNLSGMFDLPVLLGNTGSDLASASSTRGSFFTGVLATAVATPCTAPFMASAVGVALTLPAWQALLVFEALGFGLALPFLLISIFPGMVRFLPKPGAWMETFKQFLAFLMYASVIWLLWVLTLQTSAAGMVVALAGMLLIVLAIWMKRIFTSTGAYRVAALLLLVLVGAITLPALSRMELMDPGKSAEMHEVETVSYSPKALETLRAEGKAVFVDATAAWCITCQVNGQTAIHVGRTMEAFKEHNVTLMIADWTRRNAEIGEFLKSFGYQGVPLYVFYPADGSDPVVLPQLLTPDIVINTIKGERS